MRGREKDVVMEAGMNGSDGNAETAAPRPRIGRALAAIRGLKVLRSIFMVGLGLAPAVAFTAAPARASVNETCLECHSDPAFSTQHGRNTVSLFVDSKVFGASVHASLDCTDCHSDADPENLPHPEGLAPVECGACHDQAEKAFEGSIHGQALKRGAPYAPSCKDCHGTHDILSPRNTDSPTYHMNIPYLCGGCHREGAPVAKAYRIAEHNIIENYSQSIHGEGLFKKGLTVTATCTDCHGSHTILPHTDAKASIAPGNIAHTCMKCHSRIEQVHTKVIRGELWEKAPGKIPACTDCHIPHKVRKETVAMTISDRDCLKCHERDDLRHGAAGDTLSLTVNKSDLAASVHQNIPCVKCHFDVDPRLARPCTTAGRVDCSSCHAKVSEEYFASGHGQAYLNGAVQAPYCTTCHGDHKVKPVKDEEARTYRANVPALCGGCHRTNGKAGEAADLAEKNAFSDYSQSVHGRGLTEKGLLPSAICTDCHTAHFVLKHGDPRSSVSRKNIPATCASCHRGIYNSYVKSVHFAANGKNVDKLPTCTDCHSAHTIGDVDKDQFMTEVTGQCGSCHDKLATSYLETMHGKAYSLGYLKAAKCSDCHGAHDIYAINDPRSAVAVQNIVHTCSKCHDDANTRFTGYLTHATHHDPVKYPILFYTYWSMTFLLFGVFGFFGVHTLLWLPRSFRAMKERRKESAGEEGRYFVRRFTRSQRITHVFVIVSFLSLALTGMMLKFSSMPWAEFVAGLLGGVRVAGVIHRIAACITFGYFGFHVFSLLRHKRHRHLSFKELLFGKNALMFNLKDAKDFQGTLKWFFNRGPRPNYGRWTYWEKFDYLAVFWGVAVIGASGLMLWFPEAATRVLPGWLINVATIIHSDEALLAVGFIFTIHFFNTHLRPEAFPMDTVIFTGVTPLKQYKEERPEEIEELRRTGELGKRVVSRAPERNRRIMVRIFGSLALGMGVLIIVLIVYSVLFGYR